MIDVSSLTMKYPSGKGIFDLDFSVKEGEVMGYLGPNGAGKTTTIRALLGFMNPNVGSACINGLDCWKNASQIQKLLGYIPGEITFPDNMSGEEFLKFMHDMRNMKDTSRQKELIDMFEFNPKGKIRKFSKGMKQKLGIITAFMHDPKVLILDEPTSGLDPLMQNRFVELILSEKKAGKTILMSSHIFEEVERTCDNVLIIKEGRIVKQSDVQTLKSTQRKCFIIRTADTQTAIQVFNEQGFNVEHVFGDSIEVSIGGSNIDKFLKSLAKLTVISLDIKVQSLEDIFMHFYGKEETL